MPRNGSGSFSLVTNSWSPATNGVPATAGDFQTLINDVATALTQSVSKDGQTPLTGDLPAGGNKITGLEAGTASGDSLRWEQLFSQGVIADIASASTVDIGGQLTSFLNVTGTTTITSFGTNYNGPRYLKFAGALTLTHSSSLVLPASTNITTAAGDVAIVMPISGGWQVAAYQRAAGLPVFPGPLSTSGITGAAESGAKSSITSLTGLTSPVAEIRQIQPISASVSANALTISASALSLEFRSATLTSGAVSFVEGTPSNLVISSGSTLGTVSGQQSRIVVLAINNAGSIELAAVNLSGGNDLSETGLISTTAEGGAGAADSASTVYSTTARTNVSYRVIGYIESTQATAGTWATAPSTIQGAGGQALTAMSSLGYGQTWQTVTRNAGTNYYNTTGKPITLSLIVTAGSTTVAISVDGVFVAQEIIAATSVVTLTAIIPPGSVYSITNAGTATYTAVELR